MQYRCSFASVIALGLINRLIVDIKGKIEDNSSRSVYHGINKIMLSSLGLMASHQPYVHVGIVRYLTGR